MSQTSHRKTLVRIYKVDLQRQSAKGSIKLQRPTTESVKLSLLKDATKLNHHLISNKL